MLLPFVRNENRDSFQGLERTVFTAFADSSVGVIALVIASKAVVEVLLLNDQLERSIIGPPKTKEPREKVLGGFNHAVLGSSTGDDLATVVGVQVAVTVVVGNARVEQA